MLSIKQQHGGKSFWRWSLGLIGIPVFIAGCYIASLIFAPAVSLAFTKPISAAKMPQADASNNRIIIPNIGVNIPYNSDDATALTHGAWWRHSEYGNPEQGGNFIITAHRLSIQTTPQQTIEKSPFYHLDQLKTGHSILVDYNGTRYGYSVEKTFTAPDITEIEQSLPEGRSRLTLYGYDTSDNNRTALYAKPLGPVTIKNAD